MGMGAWWHGHGGMVAWAMGPQNCLWVFGPRTVRGGLDELIQQVGRLAQALMKERWPKVLSQRNQRDDATAVYPTGMSSLWLRT